MWQNAKNLVRRIQALPGIAYLSALIGGLTYLILAYTNALNRTSFLDEGLYLYKGYLFASGKYVPFADFAPWTNHMPLSFLVHGAGQVLFEPGLRTGRYFSIFLAVLMISGLWVVTRRMAGRWWAAGVVWALALNIASIKLYTLAISQVIVAALLAWTLAFTLGEGRKMAQIVLGAFLGSVIFFVRINMAPIVPLLVGYVFWEHGRKKGLAALLASAIVLVIGHLLFWPGILKIWAAWVPSSLSPWLDAWRVSGSVGKWVTSAAMPDNLERVLYFFMSFRLHYLSLFGAFTVLLLWPKSASQWKSSSQMRASVFLSVTLLILFAIHLLAAFYLGFCISCVLLYVAFFDFLGLVLLAISFSAIEKRMPIWRELVTLIVVFLMGLGIAYSAFGEVSAQWAGISGRIFGWDLKRFPLWGLFKQLGISRYHTHQIFVAMTSGVVLMGGLALLTFLIIRLQARRGERTLSPSFTILCLSLIVALIFSPTVVFSRGNDFFACNANVLQAYKASGAFLRQNIPSRAQVFWVGRLPALLLYLPDIRIYPPQLNHFHNLRSGGDDQELYRFGLWSETLGRQWLTEADVVLVEDQWLDGWVLEAIQSMKLSELPAPPLPEPCRENSRIHLYIKK